MKLRSIILLLLLVGIVACKSNPAFDYSEAIVKIERSLTSDISLADDQIGGYLKTGKFDSAAIASKRMEDLLNSKLEEVKKLQPPGVKEAGQFQKAAIRYFTYMKNIYTSYKDYSMQTTDNGRETERQKLLRIVNDKERVVEDMQRAQRKYAEANGFRIDNNK